MAKQATQGEIKNATAEADRENTAATEKLKELITAAGFSKTVTDTIVVQKQGEGKSDILRFCPDFKDGASTASIFKAAAQYAGLHPKIAEGYITITYVEDDFDGAVDNAVVMAGRLRNIFTKTGFILNPTPEKGESPVARLPDNIQAVLLAYYKELGRAAGGNTSIAEGTEEKLNAARSSLSEIIRTQLTDADAETEALLLKRAITSDLRLEPLASDLRSKSSGRGNA